MVHALEAVHRLLAPGGLLIDLHPSGQPPPVVVRAGTAEHLAGWVEEEDDYREYELATAALDTAVARGLFRFVRRSAFTFATYTDTIDDLLCFFEYDWHDASVSPQTLGNIENWQRTAVDSEIIVREIVSISALTPRPFAAPRPHR